VVKEHQQPAGVPDILRTSSEGARSVRRAIFCIQSDSSARSRTWPRLPQPRVAKSGLSKSLGGLQGNHDPGNGALEPVAGLVVKQGFFAEWMRRRGRPGPQDKVPRVFNDPDLFRDLREFRWRLCRWRCRPSLINIARGADRGLTRLCGGAASPPRQYRKPRPQTLPFARFRIIAVPMIPIPTTPTRFLLLDGRSLLVSGRQHRQPDESNDIVERRQARYGKEMIGRAGAQKCRQ
jgi:hypothetical protein